MAGPVSATSLQCAGACGCRRSHLRRRRAGAAGGRFYEVRDHAQSQNRTLSTRGDSQLCVPAALSTHRHPPPDPPCRRWRTRATNPMVHKRNKSSDPLLVLMKGLINELPVSMPMLLLIGGALSRPWAGGTNGRPDVSLWARWVWTWKKCLGAGPIHVGSRIQAFVSPSGRFCVSS